MQLSPSANFADVTEKQRFETISTCAPVNLGLVRTGDEIEDAVHRGTCYRYSASLRVLEKPFWLDYQDRPMHFAIADEVDGRISC